MGRVLYGACCDQRCEAGYELRPEKWLTTLTSPDSGCCPKFALLNLLVGLIVPGVLVVVSASNNDATYNI